MYLNSLPVDIKVNASHMRGGTVLNNIFIARWEPVPNIIYRL